MIHPYIILESTSRAFFVHPESVWSASRQQIFSAPRKVTAYLIRKHTDLSMEDIAYFLNRRDHSTSVYWVKQIEDRVNNGSYVEIVSRIEDSFKDAQQTTAEIQDLCNAHSILREGSRHTRCWHRLQWILQCLPGQEVPVSRAGSAESGRPVEANN